MTEHFTREEAVKLARVIAAENGDTLKAVPEESVANLLHGLCNAAVTAKLKGWEAQGAAAKCVWGGKIEHLHEGPPSKLVGALLYTHALPAQPAEPVNAELVKALKKLLEQYDELAEEDNSGWILAGELAKANHAREVLSRAQAAPAVGVPAFPERIMRQLIIMADRVGDEFYGPWEDGNGEPLQDDADAAIAWIASAQPQQKEG